MRIIQAIQTANEFLLNETGVAGEPVFVRLVDRGKDGRFWLISYEAALFFQDELSQGAVIDGGEYIVRVDVQSGRVSVVA